MSSKWGKRVLIIVGAVFGAFLLLAIALQVPAVGQTIGSPEACGTCHVMTKQVVTLERGVHRDLACVECHVPTGFIEKPVEEIRSASRHAYIFVTNQTPDIIQPTHSSRQIIQAQCADCHSATLRETSVAEHGPDGLLCFECHRDTTHGMPLRN